MPWGCAPRASPRSWRPPRAPLRASTAASPPPRTTSPTPSLVSAVLHRALAPACVRNCARVSLSALYSALGAKGLRAPARVQFRKHPPPARTYARRPLAATQPQHSRAAWHNIRGVAQRAQSGASLSLLHRVSCRLTRRPPARACPSSSSPQATSTRRGVAALYTQAAWTGSLTTMSRMPPNLRSACSWARGATTRLR